MPQKIHQSLFVQWWGLVALCFFVFVISSSAQPVLQHEKHGRQLVPYDPPNDQQVKIELTYAAADLATNGSGNLQWKIAQIKQFPVTGGDPQMVAETPECVSDQRLDEITSTNSLTVHANRGSIFLEGVGFLFHHTNMSLVISNKVHSVLRLRPATNAPAPATDIFSDRGEFEMKTDATNGMALYIRNVHVLDPQMKLDCDWLRADLPKDQAGQTNRPNHIVARTNVVIDFANTNGEKIHAVGQQAVYDYRVANAATNESLELTGNPRVDLTNGWMTADTLVMDRATGKLRGVGNFHFHYHPPSQAVETEIVSDLFDYDSTTRLANFWGNVRVKDPRLKLTSEFLTATLPAQQSGGTNHIDHILAETNVVMDFAVGTSTNKQETHASGQKAVYDYKVKGGVTNEVMELTGNPGVQLDKGWMTADFIKVDRAQGRVWGTGSHHSVIKKQPGETAMMDTEIFSDNFEYATTNGIALYSGNVRAYDPELNLTQAKLLTVELAGGAKGATNIHKIIAGGNVALDFAAKAFATGDITNLPAFAARLKSPQDAPAKFVSAQLTPPTQKLLAVYTGGTNAQLQKALAEDLNRITQNGPVYEPARFTNVFLSVETSRLMKENAMGLDLIQLNRLLLLDAFRGVLARGRLGEKTHATGERAVYTSQGPNASTSALLELYGHPKLFNPSGWMEADDSIIYNRLTGVGQYLGNPKFHPNIVGLVKRSGTAKNGTQ
ncbi:MAG TPA: LptA/OstA family protein [Verrucomicrobiae bacterium]|nr:LptA/OstA family protein [Verrucomicrobiae bacterium]